MSPNNEISKAGTALIAAGGRLGGFFEITLQRFDRGVDHTLERLKQAEDKRLARTFLSEADAIEFSTTHVGAQALVYVIAALVVFALGWSVFGKVDKIVSAPGRIATSAPQVVMQAYSTSRISAILVNPGDHIAKGQIVARFDPTFAHADQASLDVKNRSLKAEIARIQAELDGAQTFPATLATDAETAEQAKIFADQMPQFRAQMDIWKSRADGLNSNIAANQAGIAGLQAQLKMAEDVVKSRRNLLEQHAGPAMDVMVAESSQIDAEMRLKSLVGDTQKLMASRAENEADRTNFVNKWQDDLRQRLVAAQTELASAGGDLRKAGKLSSFVDLRAPVGGTVLEVVPGHSVGSILKEGETLVTMVPDNSPLFIQAEVSPRDLANLRPGQPVRVKLDSYPYQLYGVLNGHLKVLSADSIPSRSGDKDQPVYQARIALDDSAAALARRGIHVQPGLTAKAEVITGRRSVASYIFNPLLGIADEGMRSPDPAARFWHGR